MTDSLDDYARNNGPTLEICGCVTTEEGELEPCWNHGRFVIGHPAYMDGLARAWGWRAREGRTGTRQTRGDA